MSTTTRWLSTILVVALLAGAYIRFGLRQTPSPEPAPDISVAQQAQPIAEAAPAEADESPIRYPVEAITTEPQPTSLALPPLAESDSLIQEALVAWLGRAEVLRFLQLDDFIRRVVATTDNLARGHSSPMRWPVDTTPGRFGTIALTDTGEEAIAPDNALRYVALLTFIGAIDTRQAVRFYVRHYPLFQQAYEELGYPGRHFNDRLVGVIDHLLETPFPPSPVRVRLVEVKGPVPSVRPWVRYEFSDPALEALSSGQKILIRSGSDHHRRLHAQLQVIRRHLTQPEHAAPR